MCLLRQSHGVKSLRNANSVARLAHNTPARKALEIALEPSKRPRGRPPLNWITMMKEKFSRIGLTWDQAFEVAQDRIEWNNMYL